MGKGAALVVLALAIVVTSAARGADAPAANVIHASGHAVVKVVADTARVECSVRTKGTDAIAAAQEATTNLQQLREVVTRLNLPGMTLRDTGVSVGAGQNPSFMGVPIPEAPDAGGPAPGSKPPTYTAVGALVVTLHGDEAALHKNAAQAISAALAASAPNLVTASATYLKEDDGQERQAAWEQATHNAVANAQAMARGLGVTVTGYGEISVTPRASENPWGDLMSGSMAVGRSMMERMFSGEGAAPDVAPLQVEVTVYLDATYK
ncbi:MAG TPA: SIMPL domain-containing protein [Armatimonadota bacterium]